VMAHRVQYQHNKKAQLDENGNITLQAPIDISFGSETHSEYFASERGTGQLADLRTLRWEMKDDWWAAACNYSYDQPKKLSGKAKGWLDKIKDAHPRKLAASDGASLDSATKKAAPHFDAQWDTILNQAVVRGTGRMENTEEERRAEIASQGKKAKDQKQKRGLVEEARLASLGADVVGIGTLDGVDYPEMTRQQAFDSEMGWRES